MPQRLRSLCSEIHKRGSPSPPPFPRTPFSPCYLLPALTRKKEIQKLWLLKGSDPVRVKQRVVLLNLAEPRAIPSQPAATRKNSVLQGIRGVICPPQKKSYFRQNIRTRNVSGCSVISAIPLSHPRMSSATNSPLGDNLPSFSLILTVRLLVELLKMVT